MVKKKVNNNNPILKFIEGNKFLLTVLFAIVALYVATVLAPIRQGMATMAKDIGDIQGDVENLQIMVVPRTELQQLYDRINRIEDKVDRIIELLGGKVVE